MSEGAVLENQEVSGGNNRPKSLLKALNEYKLGKMALKDIPHVVEKVDHVDMVNQIVNFYGLPQEALEQGLKIEMYVLKDESFISLHQEIFGARKRETGGQETGEKEEGLTNDQEFPHGLYISTKSGRKIIFIKQNAELDREDIIVHEIIHNLSADDKRQLSGFVPKQSKPSKINEAATEVLNLAFRYRDISTIEQLYGKVYHNEIQCGYQDAVLDLLFMMLRTEYNKKPFTPAELAKYYSHTIQGENIDFLAQMTKEITSRTMPELQEDTSRQLKEYASDFKD